MNKSAFNKIATALLLGTTVSALLMALPGTSNGAQPIAIHSCTDITTSGSYKLVADLTGSSNCITIWASNVDLRLNGHTITGSGTNTLWWGIGVVVQTNVKIKGPGLITNFAFGVRLNGTDSSEVTEVTANNNGHGFVVVSDFPDVNNFSEENSFKRNTATGNVSRGFFSEGASNNSFLNNVASDNEVGVFLGVGTGNHVKGNTTNGNSSIGIGTAGETSNAHTIEDNIANGNGRGFGIRLGSGSTGNNVNGNTTINCFIGIALQVSSGNNVNGNTTLNNDFGIALIQGSTDNNIDGNMALDNSLTDLTDDSIACDNNIWTNNVFNTANQTCIQ